LINDARLFWGRDDEMRGERVGCVREREGRVCGARGKGASQCGVDLVTCPGPTPTHTTPHSPSTGSCQCPGFGELAQSAPTPTGEGGKEGGRRRCRFALRWEGNCRTVTIRNTRGTPLAVWEGGSIVSTDTDSYTVPVPAGVEAQRITIRSAFQSAAARLSDPTHGLD